MRIDTMLFVCQAYLIACVWNCYRYVSGRGTTEVLVYVTTNDTTVSQGQFNAILAILCSPILTCSTLCPMLTWDKTLRVDQTRTSPRVAFIKQQSAYLNAFDVVWTIYKNIMNYKKHSNCFTFRLRLNINFRTTRMLDCDVFS